jgi:hypothetical protein
MPVRYIAMLPAAVPPPYDTWSVDHRYVAAAQLGHEDLERWMWTAIVVRHMLEEAVNRGEAQ